LVDPDHVHHHSAAVWFVHEVESFSTCPMTQGSLVRHLLRAGHPGGDIAVALERIQRLEAHVFWPDELPITRPVIEGQVGHRQVADAYLCAVARHRAGRVATFDRGLIAIHSDVAIAVPIG
jgi:predicted nucleic acid-binding protein